MRQTVILSIEVDASMVCRIEKWRKKKHHFSTMWPIPSNGNRYTAARVKNDINLICKMSILFGRIMHATLCDHRSQCIFNVCTGEMGAKTLSTGGHPNADRKWHDWSVEQHTFNTFNTLSVHPSKVMFTSSRLFFLLLLLRSFYFHLLCVCLCRSCRFIFHAWWIEMNEKMRIPKCSLFSYRSATVFFFFFFP